MKPNPILAPITPPSIVEALRAAIGIDPRALDPGRLKWIIGARCRHLKLADAETYAAYLEANPAELDALIDVVVVQETRFFRDPVVFDHIRIAIGQLVAKFPGPLRILSAPCGTGQEAYSLAAMLTLVGVPPQRFHIDAVDISLSALEIACRGIYPEHALTHVSPELQNACGSRRHKHWQVHEPLAQRIRFERRNLAEPGALAGEPPYHLILCRNLFIYLHADARTALSESLASALVPGGRLVIGTADRVEELNLLFSPVRPASSFAFVHRELALPAPAPSPVKRPVIPPIRLAQFSAPARLAAPAQPEAGPTLATTAADLFNAAIELQRHGELVKAERRCRQALYLAPNHLPALELLQSLWSHNPNLRLRRALRDRILRTQLAAPIEAVPAQKELV